MNMVEIYDLAGCHRGIGVPKPSDKDTRHFVRSGLVRILRALRQESRQDGFLARQLKLLEASHMGDVGGGALGVASGVKGM